MKRQNYPCIVYTIVPNKGWRLLSGDFGDPSAVGWARRQVQSWMDRVEAGDIPKPAAGEEFLREAECGRYRLWGWFRHGGTDDYRRPFVEIRALLADDRAVIPDASEMRRQLLECSGDSPAISLAVRSSGESLGKKANRRWWPLLTLFLLGLCGAYLISRGENPPPPPESAPNAPVERRVKSDPAPDTPPINGDKPQNTGREEQFRERFFHICRNGIETVEGLREAIEFQKGIADFPKLNAECERWLRRTEVDFWRDYFVSPRYIEDVGFCRERLAKRGLVEEIIPKLATRCTVEDRAFDEYISDLQKFAEVRGTNFDFSLTGNMGRDRYKKWRRKLAYSKKVTLQDDDMIKLKLENCTLQDILHFDLPPRSIDAFIGENGQSIEIVFGARFQYMRFEETEDAVEVSVDSIEIKARPTEEN